MQDWIERRKIGIAKKPPMKIPIECRELQFVISFCRFHHIARKLVQVEDKCSALIAQSPDDTVAFDLLPDAKHLDGFIDSACRYLGAAVALTPHEPFFL